MVKECNHAAGKHLGRRWRRRGRPVGLARPRQQLQPFGRYFHQQAYFLLAVVLVVPQRVAAAVGAVAYYIRVVPAEEARYSSFTELSCTSPVFTIAVVVLQHVAAL